jgi:isopenicillin-N N-acyltransferase-like protein
MTPRRLLVFVIPFVLAARAAAAEPDAPFRFPEARHGKGELRYVSDVPVLTVEGTPEEIGEEVAVLAIKPAKRVLDYPRELLRVHRAEGAWPWLVLTGRAMLASFPPDHRRELDAIIKAGADRDREVAGNTMFDIKGVFACSSLLVTADRSETGNVLLGRNLDYPSLGYIHRYSLVTVYRPKGKHAFAAVGFPGLVGCLSGMNDAGLCVAVHESCSAKDGVTKFDVTGTPYALCYRRLLEECTTVDEAEKLLRSMRRTTIINLAVADRKGGAVFEVTPRIVAVRRPQEGTCSCTNHFLSKELRPAVQRNVFWTLDRYETLEQARELREIGVEDVHQYLQAVSVQNHTLQTMVFEPATRRLHLAIGACPSSGQELKLLELGPLFKQPSDEPGLSTPHQ